MSADNILQRRVLSDKGVVTYRLLSRLLNCHVNEAKLALQTFREKNLDACHATYIVSGTLKPVKVNGHTPAPPTEDDGMLVDQDKEATTPAREEEDIQRTVFELVQEEELEACKARFDKVASVSVYSVEKKRLADISLVVPSNKSILTDAKCKKNIEGSKNGAAFGVLQLPPRKATSGKKLAAAPPSPIPERTASSSKPASKGKGKDDKPASKAKVDKPASKAAEPSKKKDKEPEAANTVDKGKGKAPAVTSEEIDTMDWDDAAEEELLRVEQAAGGDSQTPSVPPETESMEVDAPAPRKRVRKKRTVKKTIRDEKGNRRTQEVEESYSESEGEPASSKPAASAASKTAAAPPKKPAAKPATQPAKKPAPPQGNKSKPQADDQGQTSLSSFFKKPAGGGAAKKKK